MRWMHVVSIIGSLVLSITGWSALAQDLSQTGVAAAVRGEVQLARAGAAVGRQAESGEPIYLNDAITSGPDSGMQILLLDETVFTIGPQSEILINEFVYDPGTGTGRLAAEMTRGVLRFVTGKVASGDPKTMTISVPMGSIGIRGTIGVVRILTPEQAAEQLPQLGGVAPSGPVVFAGLAGPGFGNNADRGAGAFDLIAVDGTSQSLTREGFAAVVIDGQVSPPFRAPQTLMDFDMGVATVPAVERSSGTDASSRPPASSRQGTSQPPSNERQGATQRSDGEGQRAESAQPSPQPPNRPAGVGSPQGRSVASQSGGQGQNDGRPGNVGARAPASSAGRGNELSARAFRLALEQSGQQLAIGAAQLDPVQGSLGASSDSAAASETVSNATDNIFTFDALRQVTAGSFERSLNSVTNGTLSYDFFMRLDFANRDVTIHFSDISDGVVVGGELGGNTRSFANVSGVATFPKAPFMTPNGACASGGCSGSVTMTSPTDVTFSLSTTNAPTPVGGTTTLGPS